MQLSRLEATPAYTILAWKLETAVLPGTFSVVAPGKKEKKEQPFLRVVQAFSIWGCAFRSILHCFYPVFVVFVLFSSAGTG